MIQEPEEPHEHRIGCVGCNFRSTIERCYCSNPNDHEFLCTECKGETLTKAIGDNNV